MHAVRYWFALIVTLTALSVDAQQITVQVTPVAPTATEAVSLVLTPGAYWMGSNVTRTGNHSRISLNPCMITCPLSLQVNLGALPAGAYTYEFVEPFGRSVPGGSFIVAGQIPTLSPAALATVFALLAVVGLFAAGRHP